LISFQTSLSINIGVTVVSPVKPPSTIVDCRCRQSTDFKIALGLPETSTTTSHSSPLVSSAHHLHHVFFFDIDGPRCAKFLGELEPGPIATDAGDKYFGRAGVLRSECTARDPAVRDPESKRNRPFLRHRGESPIESRSPSLNR
jgi:hypothetical protein